MSAFGGGWAWAYDPKDALTGDIHRANTFEEAVAQANRISYRRDRMFVGPLECKATITEGRVTLRTVWRYREEPLDAEGPQPNPERPLEDLPF